MRMLSTLFKGKSSLEEGEEDFVLSNGKKQMSNMTLRQKIVDMWYRILENVFAQGTYFVGKDVFEQLDDSSKKEYLPVASSLVVVSEQKNASFGNDIRFEFRMGDIFARSILVKKFLWMRLYFFQPFSIGDSNIRLALGRRCFFENDTLVLDVTRMRAEGSHNYILNVPAHVAPVLRSIKFGWNKKNEDSDKKECVACNVSYSNYVNRGCIQCVRTDNVETGTSKLEITCLDGLQDILPKIVQDTEAGKLTSIGSSKRFADGFYFVRADKTGFLDEQDRVFGLCVGEDGSQSVACLTLETEKAKRLEKALQALGASGTSRLDFVEYYVELDEMYVGDNAIYLRWHRGWTNLLKEG